MSSIKLHFLLLFLIPQMLLAQDQDKTKRIARQAYNQAIENIRNGNYQLALSYLDSAIDLDPLFTEALLGRAKARIELGQVQMAIKDMEAVIRRDDSNGEAWFYLGYLQFKGSPDSLVLSTLNKAIEKGYKTPQSYYARGLCKLVSGNYLAAIEDFTYSLSLDGTSSLAYHNRGVARYMLGDLKSAIEDFRQAVNYNHTLVSAIINIGIAKTELGDYAGAIEEYSAALGVDSTNLAALNNRGTAKYHMGDQEGAMLDFNKALLSSDRLDRTASNNKACLLAGNAGYDDALKIFDEVIATDAGFSKAYLNRGMVKELKGDLEGACADWKKAYELGLTEAEQFIRECK